MSSSVTKTTSTAVAAPTARDTDKRDENGIRLILGAMRSIRRNECYSDNERMREAKAPRRRKRQAPGDGEVTGEEITTREAATGSQDLEEWKTRGERPGEMTLDQPTRRGTRQGKGAPRPGKAMVDCFEPEASEMQQIRDLGGLNARL